MRAFPRLVAAAFALGILLLTVGRVAHADPLDDEARRIGKQLQCPVCSGASVADSPSDLAGQMRAVIRAKLEAGERDDQIIAYFVERYGVGVLIEPPRRGIGLAVWLAPITMLAAGAVLLWRLLKGWLRPRWSPGGAPPAFSANGHRAGAVGLADPAPPSSAERARAELERFRREA
jgi:cytochrome c-type biogenesis protein CcmH